MTMKSESLPMVIDSASDNGTVCGESQTKLCRIHYLCCDVLLAEVGNSRGGDLKVGH
jgi:hypothetical protein